MGEMKLLDCTLRDGGYVNDWEFGHDNLVSVFERVVDAHIDMIEIGFLNDKRPFDINRSIMPNTDSISKIYGELTKKDAMVVAMIDYGTCALHNIKPCEETFIDGIRVIFKKHLRTEALAYCESLKKLGYKVFVQLVSVTSYSDEEMLDLINLANNVEPYAVSMVDTYGLMHQNNLSHYFSLLDQYLKAGIGIGYHAHNNFQMGYANCIAMLSHQTNRMMIVDGSIYGMGKSAGNAPLELIAMHMNEQYGKHYHISQILEAIDSNISNFYQPASWGYNMFYYMAALNDCHPEYVSYLMNKSTLSVKSINEILMKLQGEKKLLFNKDYIEQLYLEYQRNECNDTTARAELKQKFKGKEILLIGPGKTVLSETSKIEQLLQENDLVVIAVNFIPKCFEVDLLFMSNAKRYIQMATAISRTDFKTPIIATSNVTKTMGKFDYFLNFSSLLDEKAMFADNPLIMLLKFLNAAAAKEIYLAGFDGYTKSGSSDYVNPSMAYSFSKSKALEINEDVMESMKRLKLQIPVNFVTTSHYNLDQ